MLGTTLQKIEEALGEIATAVSKHSTILLITKMKAFPKITLNPDKNEAISHATDELIRCQRALNNARRHLTNLGIEPQSPGHGSEEKTTQSTQSSESSVRQPIRTDVPRVLGKPIGLPDNLSPHSES
jgi:hypothetical protein